LLALGNPAFDRTSGDAGAALPPLPATEREARTIAALYDPRRTRLLVGTAATESRVKREADHYRVLHLATHGMLDDADPMYSALMLARPQTHDAGAGASGPPVTDDGRLEARELMDLRLDADSSCCRRARPRAGASAPARASSVSHGRSSSPAPAMSSSHNGRWMPPAPRR
jgi:CHAT domain-containing protein